jgi:2-dehydro-3-deoxyphosphogluconate aldolase/(4S)-4-hydroxy-2-oxoglutarate aldolase
MARHDKLAVLTRLHAERLVALFHTSDPSAAVATAGALKDGGISVVEFTDRGDRSLDPFTAIAAERDRAGSDLVLGVGSVVDGATASQYMAAGADFIVGPSFVSEVALVANRRQIPYLPGTSTLTEMLTASEAGCEVLKLFPGGHGGPDLLKAILAPCPWLRVMPTGGVSPDVDSLGRWFRAGAVCVGLGSQLVGPDAIAAADWRSIRAGAEKAVEARSRAVAAMKDTT